MRKVPLPVSAAGSLIILGIVLFGLVRYEEADLHWLFLFPATGAIVLGGFVLFGYYLFGWRR